MSVRSLVAPLVIAASLVTYALSPHPVAAETISPADETAGSDLPAPITRGVNHIGFTVSDLDGTTSLFTVTLGWREVGGDPSYPARFVTDGAAFVTLWQATEPERAVAFDRKHNVGLHHFAMTVPDLETLEALHKTLLAHPKVQVEFGPELNGNGPTIHMMVKGPSGLRLEFAVPGERRRASE